MLYSISPFVQQVFNGISLGSVYALVAIGYSMVYGIIGMINFAHGEIYMIGAYVGLLTLTVLLSFSWKFYPIFMVIIMILVAIIVTGAYGFAVERIAYRPVRKSQRLIALISAIGTSIFLQNLIALAQGARDRAIPNIIIGSIQFNIIGDFKVIMSYSRLLIIATMVLLMIALSILTKYSRSGLASRACSEDIYMANLLGIDTNRIISLSFVVGAALAAVGGVLISLTTGKINPFIGFIAGMKAFTAAVLGGIGSLPGAMFGGLLLGLIETLSSAYISSQYKDIITFSLLILILSFRPTGLFGTPNIEKI